MNIWVAIEVEKLLPGEPRDAPTIVETWGPFVSEDSAIDWADRRATLIGEHHDVRAPRHTFHVMALRPAERLLI